MANKTFAQIESDIIDNILTINPAIDVKIGTVIRDIFIDANASEIEVLYAIGTNVSLAQSVTTAQGYQLDLLAYNFGVKRNPPIRSSGTLTISIKAGIQAPTPLNIGDQYSTSADQNNDSQIFINTQYQLLSVGQTQATVPIVALNPGADGDVGSYTITNSSYDFADAVYNVNPTTGGEDQESDAALAARIPVNYTGQYINTARGMISTVYNIEDINGLPYFVTPDSSLSRGPYTVDAYLQLSSNYYGTAVNETAPANSQNYVFLNQPLYSLNPINQITTYDPVTGSTTNIDSNKYQIINDPTDVLQFYKGTIKANQQLQWLVAPPTNPYTISYNYDHTIIDSQALYDQYTEVVADVLYKQATAIPVYISGNISILSGTDIPSLYSNAQSNLSTLFNNLNITQSLTEKDVEFYILTDRNVQSISLNNFDSTIQISLFIPDVTQSSFITPSNQSYFTPFGFYYEVDTSSSVLSYNVAARLWIGNPDIINPQNQVSPGFNFATISAKSGVTSPDVISNVVTSWNATIYDFFDSTNSVLILNFASLPTSGSATITFNIIQPIMDNSNALAYLTLAPSVVSPVQQYASTVNSANPQYATFLPNDLADISQATLYQNGSPLVASTSGIVGDYTIISGPDPITGIINIEFTNQPASTDILQYGLLNPNFNISYSTSQFSRT
jgi:hypothetical protein